MESVIPNPSNKAEPLAEPARLGYKILKKIACLLALRLMMTDAKLAECMSIPHDYQHDTGSKEPALLPEKALP
jgi:hypothetical protein